METQTQQEADRVAPPDRSIEVSEKQGRFLKSWSEWELLTGSVRSGKTWIANLKFYGWICNQAIPKVDILFCGKRLESVERNVCEQIMRLAHEYGQAGNWEYTRSPLRMVYKPKKITCVCMGANDEGAEERIRGMTVQAAYCDEVPLYPRGFFSHLVARVSSGQRYKVMTCNPEGPAHWFYKDFYTQVGAQGTRYPGRVWQFRLNDNPTLTPEYVRQIEAMYTGSDYKRFVQGEWVTSDRLVYPMFGEHLVVDDYPNGYEQDRIIGIDWGFEHPMVLLLFILTKDGKWYVVDEIVKTHAQVDTFLLAEIDKRKWRSAPVSAAYADSARPDLIQQFANLTGIVTEGADKDVAAGISTVQNLLDKCRINILSDCKHLIDGLRTYQRKADKDGNVTDVPEKTNDDEADALRYAMHTYNPHNKEWAKYDNAVTG